VCSGVRVARVARVARGVGGGGMGEGCRGVVRGGSAGRFTRRTERGAGLARAAMSPYLMRVNLAVLDVRDVGGVDRVVDVCVPREGRGAGRAYG
jgi:hypothetical protein